ncbi:MAG TPA: group 1 truncated hemoglobin [Ignavibacteria bacterium]|nr:group 1 truncated hemoglobin [Ignavibacteria bacterium]
MKKLFIGILFLVACSSAFSQTTMTESSSETQMMTTGSKTEESLYKRVGGYDAICAVVDDFIVRLATDKELGKFFGGQSTDSQMKLRQKVVDFLCNATGGPCYYTGRSMKESHKGLGITEKDWDASVVHLVASFDKFSVPEKEKGELLTAVSPLKAEIVEMK